MKREFYDRNCPGKFPLFPGEVENRAEQILSALSGLKVGSALELLDLCKDAVMQYPLRDD